MCGTLSDVQADLEEASDNEAELLPWTPMAMVGVPQPCRLHSGSPRTSAHACMQGLAKVLLAPPSNPCFCCR